MYQFDAEITKDYILKYISQEEILERYLGIYVEYGTMYKSPFRDDRNPTCNFKLYRNGKVMFKDWSGDFYGDCFDAVQRMFGCSFNDALSKIASDFNLGGNIDLEPAPILERVEEIPKVIKIKSKQYSESDASYWKQYGLTGSTIAKYNVKCVEYAWLDDVIIYSYDESDPCFAYKFGTEFKLYYPLRANYRFLNTYKGLQGYTQLPKFGDVLVITKSLKDVMLLHQYDIPAVAPSSESSIISKDEWIEFNLRFDKIISLYDFDLTGVRSANKMKRLYGITPIMFTDGRWGTEDMGGKDLSDISLNIGYEEAEELINELIWSVQTMN